MRIHHVDALLVEFHRDGVGEVAVMLHVPLNSLVALARRSLPLSMFKNRGNILLRSEDGLARHRLCGGVVTKSAVWVCV